jgi:glycolate oxidase FAD binding subunit
MREMLTLAKRPLESDTFDVVWRNGQGRLLMQFSGASALEQASRAGNVVDVDWDEVRALQRGPVVVKVSGRPTDLPNVIRVAQENGATVISRAALGLSWLAFDDPARIGAIREALAPRNCTVLDGAGADQWPAETPSPPALAVMERLKARFDPARIFRPGVFVGGI